MGAFDGYVSPGGSTTSTTTAPGDNIATRFGRWAIGADQPPIELQPRSLSQAGTDVTNFGRVAGNTFGLYDRAAAALGGDTLQSEQAKTAEASKQLGTAGTIAANMVGYAPLGVLGIGGRIADTLGTAAPATRALIGGTAEGGIGGGLGAAGRDENITKGVVVGAGGGAVATPIVGIANWAGRNIATPTGRMIGLVSKPEEVTASTAAAKQAAFDAAGKYEFNSNDPIGAYTASKATLTPGQQADLSSTMNQKFNQHVNDFRKAPSVDAADLNTYVRGLNNAASSDADRVLAARIKDNVDGMMNIASPVSGQPVGEALAQLTKARNAAQQNIMALGLQDASTALKSQYESPGPWAQQQSRWYDPKSQQYQDLSKIVRASGGPGNLPSGTGAAHVAGEIGEVGLASAGMPSAGIVAGAGTQLAKSTISGMMKGIKRQQLLGKLEDIYPSLTGQSVVASPHIGDLLQTLTQAQTAGGNYPGNNIAR